MSIVALTGAAGFIGQAIAHRLLQAGWKVRGLVRTSKKFHNFKHSDFTLVPGSLENLDSLHDLLQGCTSLVHCAGAICGSTKKDFSPTNVQGIANLLHICNALPYPPRILHISSLAAREPSLSPYAWSKREGERLFQTHTGALNWGIIRPPAVYGPNDKALLPLLQLAQKGIGLRLGPAEARFSMIHVNDLADVVLRGLEVDSLGSTIFEVDDGFANGYSWDSVFDLVNPQMKIRLSIPQKFLWFAGKSNEVLSRIFGYAPLFTTGKVAELFHPNWVCHSTKARQQLQWTPQIPLEKGLRHLFASDSLML